MSLKGSGFCEKCGIFVPDKRQEKWFCYDCGDEHVLCDDCYGTCVDPDEEEEK